MNSPKDNETQQGPQLCILLIKQQSCCKDLTVRRNRNMYVCVFMLGRLG